MNQPTQEKPYQPISRTKALAIIIAVFAGIVLLGKLAPKHDKPAPLPAETQAAAVASPARGEDTGPAPFDGVTMARYTALPHGISYHDAVAILGADGTELSSNEIGGTKTVMYQWPGQGRGANMNATFQNDKLVSKAQFGLR